MVASASLPGVNPTIVPETAASRWARETQARRGDQQMAKDGSGKPVLDARGWTTLTYDSTSRNRREYSLRGGDYYIVEANGKQSLVLDPNGRNDRQFVNYNTGISAITNAKGDRFDALKKKSSGV